MTATTISAWVQWEDFPLSVSISDFWLKFTEENDDVSVLLRVDVHSKSYHIEKLLQKRHTYIFCLLAFTGDGHDGSQIYSSQNVSVTTEEGGAC